MSCLLLVSLPALLAGALAVPRDSVPERQCLSEVQSLLQGEVRVRQLGVSPHATDVKGGTAASKQRLGAGRPGDNRNSTAGGEYSWQRALSLEVNQVGDLAVLGLSFATNGVALVACVLAFVFLRHVYPELYQNNARSADEGGLNIAPFVPDSGLCGWVRAALDVTWEQMRVACGVDEMMLVEFSNFSMRLLMLIGAPLISILCPLHLFLGGGQVDQLSKVGMSNVRHGNPLLWVHTIFVWYVVLVVENQVHRAMGRFLGVRVRWLLELEPPRSTTVLVEGIPEKCRSDVELKAYFEMLFPTCIESVHLVKKTRRLSDLTKRLEKAELRLEEAMFEWQKDPARRPCFYPKWFMRLCGSFVRQNDKIEYYKDLVAALEGTTVAERGRVLSDSREPMLEEQDEYGQTQKTLTEKAKAMNATAGFVTFTSEREARLMLSMRCTANFEEFISHVPPHHADVIYEDLQVHATWAKLSHLVGYACVVGVFFSFLPLICGIGTLASFEALQRLFHFSSAADADARIDPRMIFEGVVSSLALTTFTSFLPTILMLVFSTFFILRAHAWGQLKLQTWLFWFNLIFVVLVTSLGGTLIGRIKEALQSPLSILTVLAESLPRFTHFYLNYMLMQWAIHALNLTRYIQLIKYFIWRSIVGPERAVALTEPEDQDYYGIGSRSATWTIHLVIAIVFCTLCPVITVVTFVNFFIVRVVYGYLMVFAETRKPDLGGPFFVTQLWHVQYGLLVYVVLMIGVIWDRSGNNHAMTIVAASTALYVVSGFYRFHTHYQWEALPFEELCTDEAREDFAEQIERYRSLGEKRPCYRQQELLPRERLLDSSLEELQRQRLEAHRDPYLVDFELYKRRKFCRRRQAVTEIAAQQARRGSGVLEAGLGFVDGLAPFTESDGHSSDSADNAQSDSFRRHRSTPVFSSEKEEQLFAGRRSSRERTRQQLLARLREACGAESGHEGSGGFSSSSDEDEEPADGSARPSSALQSRQAEAARKTRSDATAR